MGMDGATKGCQLQQLGKGFAINRRLLRHNKPDNSLEILFHLEQNSLLQGIAIWLHEAEKYEPLNWKQ